MLFIKKPLTFTSSMVSRTFSIVAARWNGASRQEVSDQKKIVYLRKQVGLNQVGI